MRAFLVFAEINIVKFFCVACAFVSAIPLCAVGVGLLLQPFLWFDVPYLDDVIVQWAIIFAISCLPALFFLVLPGIAEKELDMALGGRKPSEREQEVISKVHSRLLQSAKEKHLWLPHVVYRIQDNPGINASAYGQHRVMLTSGILNRYKEDSSGIDTLATVVAHEIGHLRNWDSPFLAVIRYLTMPANFGVGVLNSTLGLVPIFSIISKIFGTICLLPLRIGFFLRGLISRQIEYRADDFACKLMGSENCAKLFNDFALSDEWSGGSILAHLQMSHPPSEYRHSRVMKRLSTATPDDARTPSNSVDAQAVE